MEDIYAALIGEGAGSGEKAALIAAALRRRNMLGQLGQITGDRVLSPVGKGLSQSSDNYAEQLQAIRQKDADNAQTKSYQDGQLGYMRDNLAETKRNNDLQHAYHMAMAEAAGLKAQKTGGKLPKLRQGDITELQDLSQSIGIVDGLQKFMSEGGTFGAETMAIGGKEVAVPGMRTFKNYAASKGFGSPEDKATFLAKQNWERLYNLAERNRLFGATLTDTEKKSWADANPSVGQTDKQIAAALPIMRKVFEHRRDKKVSGLTKEGYSAEAMADYADVPGVNLPTTVGGDEEAPQQPGPVAPTAGGAPKRVRVDAKGNIIP